MKKICVNLRIKIPFVLFLPSSKKPLFRTVVPARWPRVVAYLRSFPTFHGQDERSNRRNRARNPDKDSRCSEMECLGWCFHKSASALRPHKTAFPVCEVTLRPVPRSNRRETACVRCAQTDSWAKRWQLDQQTRDVSYWIGCWLRNSWCSRIDSDAGPKPGCQDNVQMFT